MGISEVLLESCSTASLLGALLVLVLVYLLTTSTSGLREDQREPPGPFALPFLGNLQLLDQRELHKSMPKLSRKYGSVFTVYLGSKKIVCLAGYKTVKEALVSYAEEFGERETYSFVKGSNLEYGVLWANGDSWKEMRRFALNSLKDFGMGKKVCEDKITEECQYIIEAVGTMKGKPFNTYKVMNYAVSNIICSMVFGSRFEYDDPEFTTLVDRMARVMHLYGSPSVLIYNIFPGICKWVHHAAMDEFRALSAANRKKYLELCGQLKETLNPLKPRGVADAFLIRQQQMEESGKKDSYFHEMNLAMTVSNLFAGGTETTSATIRWGLLYMAKYPEIQDRVQEELKRVVGSRQVQLEDRKDLSFTNAVIHETQRLANIFPRAVAHRTSRDVTFQGYFIKKGTTVYPLLTSVLHDEAEWEKPHTFHPAHFLDKDGKFVKRDAFMAFSAGRRVCLGESLARMELFMFFSSLLQRYRFSPPPGVSTDDLDLTPVVGSTLSPAPHMLCATPCG